MKDKFLKWLCGGLVLAGLVILFITAAASDCESIGVSAIVVHGLIGLSMMFSGVVIGVSQGV